MCDLERFEIETLLNVILSFKQSKYRSMLKDVDEVHDIEHLESVEQKLRRIYFLKIQNEPGRNQKLILDFNRST